MSCFALDVVLCFDIVLCFEDVALCFEDVMRSRHDVMFRFADVVLCFDVVRPEMTSRRRRSAVFFAALRAAVAHLLACFPLFPLSCKSQPARTQSKRSDFKRRSSSSSVNLAFKWLFLNICI